VFSLDNKIEDYILKRLSNYDLSIVYENNEIEIKTPESSLYNVLSFLQHDTHCQFEQLLDLIVLDCPTSENRFDLIYVLRSLKNNQKIRILTSVNSEVISVSEIYRDASWLEREAWEMFGVFFKNSRDLRRLLTDFTYGGYPLRKDYPPCGFVDYVFEEQTDSFISSPLSLIQEYRSFDVSSPWKGPGAFPKKEGSCFPEESQKKETQTVPEEEIK
jgi:NADH-quinone oxidoreductase subunit C